MGVSLAANAQANDGNTLVDKIAEKFNLNKADVQKVFDDNKAENQAERQQKLEQRLDKAVSDGKITSSQKEEILAKLKDFQSFIDSLKGKTPAERRVAIKAKKKELRQWAKDNKIPEGILMPAGIRAGFGSHSPDTSQDTDTSSNNN